MKLTLLYDEGCPLCVRASHWMQGQAALVPVRHLPSASEEAKARFGGIPWLGRELVIVSSRGDVWAGPAAFLVALWALRDWRESSYLLAHPFLTPFTRRFFNALSAGRHAIGAFLGPEKCSDGACQLHVAQGSPYR